MGDSRQSSDQLEALCFDVFGTLVDWRSGVARQLEEYFGSRSHLPDWGAVVDAWWSDYHPALEEIRSERRPFVTLDELHQEMFQVVAPRFGLGELSPMELRQVATFWHKLDAWPDVPDGLDRLRKQYLVAPVSDGNVRLMVDLARHNDFRWDAILGAEVAETYKFRPEVYLRSIEMLGVSPSACAMVAAHNDDLVAARAVGMRAVFVHRPLEFGEAAVSPGPTEPWDFVVGNLDELATTLGC